MVARSHVKYWIFGISILNFLGGYVLGLIYQNNSVFSPLFCLLPCVITFIALYILSCIRRKYQAKKGTFGNPITRKAEDGSYVLDPENLYEAVEKLGYFEYEFIEETERRESSDT